MLVGGHEGDTDDDAARERCNVLRCGLAERVRRQPTSDGE
jgi:hypothetical protein